MFGRAYIPLSIVTLTACGCATPHLVHWDAPVAWKFDQAISPPPATLPPPTPPAASAQFASEAVRPAGATGTAPGGISSAPTAVVPAPVVSVPEPPVIGHKVDETKSAKDPDFKLRGRIEAGAITVNQSEKNKALFGDFQNAVGFRRARLGSEGTAGEQTRWVAEIDFAGGNVALKDAFLAVNHLPYLREVRVGHIAEPFTLEGQTRSVWFPFTERSPSFTFDPTRNWGVAVYSYTDNQRLFIQAGAFKSGTDNTGTDIGDGNDLAYTARVVG